MSNLNNGQTDVIRGIISFLNDNATLLELPVVKFDELSTSKDSMCLTTTKDILPQEKVADVTGTAFRGTLYLSLTYRVMSSKVGMKDLDYAKVLDNAYEYLRQNYKSIEDEFFFIDNISQKSGGVLETVYSGGVKDFNSVFIVTYERSVKKWD